MDAKQANIVNKLKDFLLDHYNTELIILYGSTARGDTDEFSDIDIMVVMDVEDSEKVADGMLADTDHIVHDKHILIRSIADYITQRDVPGTMIFSALGEGIVLYQNPEFNADDAPEKNYEERKRDVIHNEYLEQSREFLENAEKALKQDQLFRCRDNLRFAIVRILKAIMVFRDIHPPRSTGLEVLFEKAQELLPEVGKLKPLIEELNIYCPEGNDPEEINTCRDLVDKAHFFVDGIASLLR